MREKLNKKNKKTLNIYKNTFLHKLLLKSHDKYLIYHSSIIISLKSKKNKRILKINKK